jgi:hypothetical protein
MVFLAAIFSPVFGCFWGGIKHAIKGLYKGATEGFMAGLSYPNDVYSEYFSVMNDNRELFDKIEQTEKPNLRLLSPAEIKRVELILDDTEKETFKKELANYKRYLKNTCPITNKKIKNHGDPLVVRINDKQNQADIIKIYDRAVFLRELRDNIRADNITKNKETDCIIKKDNVIADGFPKQITDFVKKVRDRLQDFDATIKNNQTEISAQYYKQYAKNKGFWQQPQPRTIIQQPPVTTEPILQP